VADNTQFGTEAVVADNTQFGTEAAVADVAVV